MLEVNLHGVRQCRALDPRAKMRTQGTAIPLEQHLEKFDQQCHEFLTVLRGSLIANLR